MSYKETLPKLERILAKIESLSSDFTIDRKVYEKSYKERLEDLNLLFKNLCMGDWKVTAEEINSIYDIEFTNTDVMHGKFNPYRNVWGVNVREAKSSEDLKKIFFNSIVECIKGNDELQLDRFADEVIKPAETIISRIDDNLYKELADIRNTNAKEYSELAAEQKELANSIMEYTDRAQELIIQAATEWFDEGNLTKGSIVFFHDDMRPRRVISISNGEIYAKLVDQNYFSSRDTENVEKLNYKTKVQIWNANNPQLRVDIILDPMSFVKD